jgi:hypothetical protein
MDVKISCSLHDHQKIGDSCNICLDVINKQHIVTNCNHLSCKSCLDKWLTREFTKYDKTTCPTCRNSLNEIYYDIQRDKLLWSYIWFMLKSIWILVITSFLSIFAISNTKFGKEHNNIILTIASIYLILYAIYSCYTIYKNEAYARYLLPY